MNQLIKGSILVALAASCYGTLTSFVKLSYEAGFTTVEITFSQLLIGFLGFLVINSFYNKRSTVDLNRTQLNKKRLWLVLAGFSIGATSIFYYTAVRYITVSLGIVLLMQSVWISALVDLVINKVPLTRRKSIAILVVLIGTILASDVWQQDQAFDLRGIGFGLLAALSFTVTLFTSNNVALNFTSVTRSKWMLLGGLIVVSTYASRELVTDFNYDVFLIWGPVLALFGTILPPLFFTTGMPKVSVGLGAIVSSLELPVAVFMGYLILGEEQNLIKWIGIVFILSAIVIMNYKSAKLR